MPIESLLPLRHDRIAPDSTLAVTLAFRGEKPDLPTSSCRRLSPPQVPRNELTDRFHIKPVLGGQLHTARHATVRRQFQHLKPAAQLDTSVRPRRGEGQQHKPGALGRRQSEPALRIGHHGLCWRGQSPQ